MKCKLRNSSSDRFSVYFKSSSRVYGSVSLLLFVVLMCDLPAPLRLLPALVPPCSSSTGPERQTPHWGRGGAEMDGKKLYIMYVLGIISSAHIQCSRILYLPPFLRYRKASKKSNFLQWWQWLAVEDAAEVILGQVDCLVWR